MAETNGATGFLRWWPVIVFCVLQTLAAGVMYGDLRAQIVGVQKAQQVQQEEHQQFVTRRELALMLDNERLKHEIERLSK